MDGGWVMLVWMVERVDDCGWCGGREYDMFLKWLQINICKSYDEQTTRVIVQ